MAEVPIRLVVGNVSASIGNITGTPNIQQSLAAFLRAVADQIDGGHHGARENSAQPQGRESAPEVQ